MGFQPTQMQQRRFIIARDLSDKIQPLIGVALHFLALLINFVIPIPFYYWNYKSGFNKSL